MVYDASLLTSKEPSNVLGVSEYRFPALRVTQPPMLRLMIGFHRLLSSTRSSGLRATRAIFPAHAIHQH
jgi:hypothetical protein